MRATERVPLGRTPLRVTRLGLGAGPLGGLFAAVGDTQAVGTVDRAWDLGLRWFDTAPLYGSGLSEQRLGAALRAHDRDEYVLATKVGRLLRRGGSGGDGRSGGQDFWGEGTGLEPVFDFSAAATRRSLEESLERLGLGRVDVLHVHDPDEHHREAVEGALPELVRMRAEGTIGAVSVGMNQAPLLAALVREADLDCVLVAGRYTLLDQSGLAELLPACVEHGVAVVAGGVFNSGLLADPRPGARFDYRPADADMLARALALQEVCARHGVPLAAAALQFPLGHPAVATVVVGARSAQEIATNVELFEVEIPGALWVDLRRAGLLADEVPTP